MKPGLDTPSRRIAFAAGVSLLVHALALWGPTVRLPQFKPSLPPLTAKLEALPTAPAKPKPKRKPRVAAPKPVPKPVAPAEEIRQPSPLDSQAASSVAAASSVEAASSVAAASSVDAASSVAAASAPVEAEPLASETEKEVDRPPLPKRARLTFTINKGTGKFRIGEAIHTLEIDDGHYVLHAVTQTVGLVSLFKTYELTQYSSGSYSRLGLQPDQFFEQRRDKLATLRYTAEFDHAAQVARFSNGGEATLPPETVDILSVMYQFPPLAHTEIAAVSVCNGRKIERYEFEITTDEEIDTALGKLSTVRLHKMHAPGEEGLDIWLAREYRLFPVKLRFTEKDGEVAAEAVITDIRVSEEQGEQKNAVD